MELAIRILLYYAFGALGAAGIGVFEPGSISLTLSADTLGPILVSFVGTGGVFLWSRIAKARGRKT